VSGPQTGAEAMDVLVELLAEFDERTAGSPSAFYNSLCEAACRLTSLDRAALLLHAEARKLVVPVGSHNIDPDLLAALYGTLEETPIARTALAEDRVVVTSELRGQVPERHVQLPGIKTLTCVPVSAGGRWLGVLFADRAGHSYTPSEGEQRTLWTLGKTSALAAGAVIATTEFERARLLSERVALARAVHERVMQRLFGLSLVLGSGQRLGPDEQERASGEIEAALGELREAIERSTLPPADTDPAFGERTSLQEELDRLGRHYKGLPLRVEWSEGVEVPDHLEPLARSVLAEALNNAVKHASPSEVSVSVASGEGAFELEIRNDGVPVGDPAAVLPDGPSMGLRLAAFEALGRGGVVEFGPAGRDEWRVRLLVPLAARTEEPVAG
jgi:signal transduction histidine kinase